MNKIQNTHPVEIGAWGRFRHGGEGIVEKWLALEDLCLEYCGGMWIGIYGAHNILWWAERKGLLSTAEVQEWFKLL